LLLVSEPGPGVLAELGGATELFETFPIELADKPSEGCPIVSPGIPSEVLAGGPPGTEGNAAGMLVILPSVLFPGELTPGLPEPPDTLLGRLAAAVSEPELPPDALPGVLAGIPPEMTPRAFPELNPFASPGADPEAPLGVNLGVPSGVGPGAPPGVGLGAPAEIAPGTAPEGIPAEPPGADDRAPPGEKAGTPPGVVP